MTLYIETGCGYSRRVMETMQELGLHPDIKNIGDKGILVELITRGGKDQVPYLVDEEHSKEMYDSGDIIHYLHQQYGSAEEKHAV